MKKSIVIALLSSVLLYSCDNTQKKQKALLNDVLKSHDQVMTDDEKAQASMAQLDNLLKQKPALKEQIAPLKAELSTADDAMMNWMHKFNPEYTSKPSAESVQYLSEQKKQLARVDAQLQDATNKAGKFISQNR